MLRAQPKEVHVGIDWQVIGGLALLCVAIGLVIWNPNRRTDVDPPDKFN